MRIVERGEFAKLPIGTVYSKYDALEHLPTFNNIFVKRTMGNEFIAERVTPDIEGINNLDADLDDYEFKVRELESFSSKEAEVDFEVVTCNLILEVKTKFVIWSEGDVSKMITQLQNTLSTKE